MTQPEQEAREMLAVSSAQAVEAIFKDLRNRKFLKWLFADDPEDHGAYGYLTEPLDLETQREISEAWRQAIENAFAARPTAGIDREVLGRLIDPDAWHETLSTDGCGTYWMSRRYNARQKADAILALFPTGAKTAPVATPAKTGERGAVIEECARICDRFEQGCEPFISHASLPLTPANLKANKQAMCRDMARAIRALSQPLPDAPIVGGEG